MGALCSCLGQREDSQDDGDLDRILNSEQPTYGTHDHRGVVLRDEEDLRRERDALEHITARAADHMIDITNPSQTDIDQARNDLCKETASQAGAFDGSKASQELVDDEDDEEAQWLRDLGEEEVEIQVPQHGNLVMDVSLLRDTNRQASLKLEYVR